MDGQVTRCWMRVRLILAVIGILVGLSATIAFAVHFHNYDCAAWGFVSGIFAAVTLYVHIQYMRDYWKVHAHQLKYWMLTGCFVQLAGVCAFTAYLVLAITQHQDLVAEGRGYYLALVWTFMTWKWGFSLFYYSRSYRRLCDENYRVFE